MPPNTPPTLGKNRWRIEKMNCKIMKQTENDQNHKNQSTPVVGKKPNGKSQMKRDMELIREILQRAESLEFVGDEPYERYWARTPAEAYQIALMKDFGLVEADVETTCGIPSRATIVRLTWAGHDFLDSSRDSKIWKLAKEHIIKPGVSWSFSILVEFLKQEMHRKIFGAVPGENALQTTTAV